MRSPCQRQLDYAKISINLYFFIELEKNEISEKGCQSISNANWHQLKHIYLCKCAVTQPITISNNLAAIILPLLFGQK